MALEPVPPRAPAAALLKGAGLCAAVALLAACAQVREPQGGPKDAAPPQLLQADPPNGSTHFEGQRIVLRFDERVKLERVRERLLVSPPLDKAPEVAVAGGRDVVITLKAPLKRNTTYTFNIGEAVVDLSEGNPAAGLTYVVSTGGHVDSLALHGYVVDAFTGRPAPDVLVLLHETADTGDVRTAPPAYFTRTNKEGLFTLTHLRHAPMHLFALVDRNGNYRYDLPTEELAFAGEPVQPGDTVPQELHLFRARSSTQFVADAKVLPDRGWQVALARPAGQLTLASLDREGGKLEWWPEWNTDRDTVVFWPSDTTWLIGQRFVLREDTAVLDTLTFRTGVPMPFNLSVTAKRHPESGDWRLESTRPVQAVDTARAQLRRDSTVAPWPVAPDSIRGRVIGLDLRPGPGTMMELVLYPKAITGVMGGTNDTTRLSLADPDPRTLGKLRVDLGLDSAAMGPGPYILQLLNGQGGVVRQAAMDSLPATADWTGIAPGSYSLKLIHDRDGDGRWSTGAYPLGLQPERVYLYPEPLNVRAGWAMEWTWKLSPQQ